MSDGTKISWTDATWNPVTGCSVVSPGCTNCYAMGLAGTRLKHHPSREGLTTKVNGNVVWNGDVRFNEGWIEQPLHWRKPRMIFVCAHGDLFHESVPDEWIAKVFGIMAVAGQPFHGAGDGHDIQKSDFDQKVIARWPRLNHGPHIFQTLTKRSERMQMLLHSQSFRKKVANAAYRFAHNRICAGGLSRDVENGVGWPLPNVWLGVSAEDMARAEQRLPNLINTPAAVRFVSYEPALDHVDMTPWLPLIDWVICGSESGRNKRPFNEDWARSLRDQCQATNTAFFYKQKIGPDGKKIERPFLDRRQWLEFPARVASGEGSVSAMENNND